MNLILLWQNNFTKHRELKERGVEGNCIIYVNFEFIEYEELCDYKKLNAHVKERITDAKMYYLFLMKFRM